MTRNPEAEPVNPNGLWITPEEAEQEQVMEDIRREVEQSAELEPANSTGKLTDDSWKLLDKLQAQHPDVVDPRSEIKTSEDTIKAMRRIPRQISMQSPNNSSFGSPFPVMERISPAVNINLM